MEKSFNLWMVKVFVVTLLILLPTVIPVHAELPDQSIPIDQSLFITGLSSETAIDSSGTYSEDVSILLKDSLIDPSRRVQKIKRQYDILNFRLDTDASQFVSLYLSVYVRLTYGQNSQTAHVYAYTADGNSVQSSNVLTFTLYSDQWNHLNVTPLLHLMDGFGFVKFRIVAVQNWFDISEASFSLMNHSPVANANGPYNGIATNPIVFYSNDSYDPDVDALSYLWDFGDGFTSVEENPTHTYTSPNKYTVTLTYGYIWKVGC